MHPQLLCRLLVFPKKFYHSRVATVLFFSTTHELMQLSKTFNVSPQQLPKGVHKIFLQVLKLVFVSVANHKRKLSVSNITSYFLHNREKRK